MSVVGTFVTLKVFGHHAGIDIDIVDDPAGLAQLTLCRKIQCDCVGRVWKGLIGQEVTRACEKRDEKNQDVERSAHRKSLVGLRPTRSGCSSTQRQLYKVYCQLA